MKPHVFLLLLSLALLTRHAPGQTRQADSLRALLRAQSQLDTTRVRRLRALAQAVKTKNAPEAIDLNRQALALARQLMDHIGEGQALLDLSNLHRRQADYEPARRFAQLARQLYARHADPKGEGKAWLQLSSLEQVQGNPTPALAAALKGLTLAEQAGDLRTKARLQSTMGSVYFQIGNYDEALTVLNATLKSGRQTGDQQLVLVALSGLGDSYRMLRKWPQAMVHYQRALRVSQVVGDVKGEVGSETSLAEVYGLQGNYARALAHGFRARRLARATSDEYNLPAVLITLARAYLSTDQVDSALVMAHDGLRLSQRTQSNENIRNASDLLAQAYAARRDFEPAYRYRNLHLAYSDTLSGEETQRKTSALRYGYELDKKQAQIALLTKTRQLQAQKAARQRQQLYGLLAGLGGVVVLAALLLRNIYLKQRTNRHLKEKNSQIAAHRDDLDRTLTELQATQNQLVQREKMASLGELTAGVAHEIQNPLNFVTNFSDLSVELVAELEQELAQQPLAGPGKQTITQLLGELAQNQTKIHQHGRRADRIVKSMLEHSRTGSGQRQPTNLNTLAEECMRLAYHGWRAQHKEFNAALITELDPELGLVPAVPQELSRVLLNLLTNAFYAVAEKSRQAGPAFRPEVCLQTRQLKNAVQVRVRDNGNGIPATIRDKIYQPFFTTKPTGEGTGLGLSLSYDIVTKGHGGSLSVESQEGEYTEFIIRLPLTPVKEVSE